MAMYYRGGAYSDSSTSDTESDSCDSCDDVRDRRSAQPCCYTQSVHQSMHVDMSFHYHAAPPQEHGHANFGPSHRMMNRNAMHRHTGPSRGMMGHNAMHGNTGRYQALPRRSGRDEYNQPPQLGPASSGNPARHGRPSRSEDAPFTSAQGMRDGRPALQLTWPYSPNGGPPAVPHTMQRRSGADREPMMSGPPAMHQTTFENDPMYGGARQGPGPGMEWYGGAPPFNPRAAVDGILPPSGRSMRGPEPDIGHPPSHSRRAQAPWAYDQQPSQARNRFPRQRSFGPVLDTRPNRSRSFNDPYQRANQRMPPPTSSRNDMFSRTSARGHGVSRNHSFGMMFSSQQYPDEDEDYGY